MVCAVVVVAVVVVDSAVAVVVVDLAVAVVVAVVEADASIDGHAASEYPGVDSEHAASAGGSAAAVGQRGGPLDVPDSEDSPMLHAEAPERAKPCNAHC